MMMREGGILVGCFFTQELFLEWPKLLVLIEDYLYASMYYRGDPEMPRPPRKVWGPDGMYT